MGTVSGRKGRLQLYPSTRRVPPLLLVSRSRHFFPIYEKNFCGEVLLLSQSFRMVRWALDW